jgi:hypothetical protein
MAPPEDDSSPRFERRFFGDGESFTQIGAGELGGKASGLQLIQREILPGLACDVFPQIEVSIPTLTVLTTGFFDKFMERNGLWDIALSEQPDDRIAHAFQKASLPAEFVGDLRALIAGVHRPLAVRSSSLLEDALEHPFAGVYGTKMIPNNQADVDTRFRRLVEAIKFVYATTFFRQAKDYILSIGQDQRGEKMAVVVQEVVGERHGDRFYPTLSGVARSYNYYPSGRSEPEEGVVSLALGLGMQIVDGGLCWTYCPVHPQAPPPYNSIGELLKNTQNEFWAIHMGKPPLPDPIRETEHLVRGDLADSEYDGTIKYLASTYDARSDRLRPGIGTEGPRLLNFAPLLAGELRVMNDLVLTLLDLSSNAVGAPVEIEFAATLDPRAAFPARFGFLQVRPMMVDERQVEVSELDMSAGDVLLASDQVLGNGTRDDLLDIVYVKPQCFEAKLTRGIAAEISRINSGLVNEGRGYLLIGFGRWGSSDPWLGIPLEWGQIGGARVIVETTLPEMNPDLSQGSHFFHNLISFKVLYLSLRHDGPFSVDWDWLERQETVEETDHVKHVRVADPLSVKVDGHHRKGVVRYGG